MGWLDCLALLRREILALVFFLWNGPAGSAAVQNRRLLPSEASPETGLKGRKSGRGYCFLFPWSGPKMPSQVQISGSKWGKRGGWIGFFQLRPAAELLAKGLFLFCDVNFSPPLPSKRAFFRGKKGLQLPPNFGPYSDPSSGAKSGKKGAVFCFLADSFGPLRSPLPALPQNRLKPAKSGQKRATRANLFRFTL